ncbi:unnamed protein product, partial [Symbiodinium pilosum]
EMEELLVDVEETSAAGSPPAADATLALSGDAFAIGEALVESMENDGFVTLGEDDEGDDEAEDEESPDVDDWKAVTEAEDLGEEEVEADDEDEDEDADEDEGTALREILVNESDEYQPGTTMDDVGQCDGDDSPRPISRETPVVDEDMLMAATAPLLIDGPAKKKRKKKKKKKKRRHSKTVAVEVLAEKKPPVPRFPHPIGPKPEKEATTPPQAAQTASERPPLRERFTKQLLLGRFPKRKPRAEGVDSAAEADGETEPEKPDAGMETSAAEDSVPEAPPPRPRRVRRARSAAEPSAAKLRPRLAGPAAEDDATQSEADKAKTLSLAVVGSKAPRLRHRSRVVVTKSIWKEEPDFDSGLGALYFSFSSMRSAEGQKVPLKNRDKVVRTLHELNSKVALPICRHFGLRYNFFSEHHPQAKKAGVTCKEPLILRKEGPDGTEIQETRYLVTIRLRLRLHPTKGDPQTEFISRGTQIAVLLHELCHLKHMNHGKDFMLFLRDIFAHAHKLGVFDPVSMSNEIPSPWPWENVIFQRAGEVSDEELIKIFTEHRAAQRKETSPATPEKDLAASQAELQQAKADVEEKDIEAISTSASDAAPEPPATPPPPPPPPPPPFAGALPSMVASFSAKGCADGCCSPPLQGSPGFTEIAYGEGESRMPGFDSPSPRIRLPPLLRPQLHSEPSQSPLPRSESRTLLPPIS